MKQNQQVPPPHKMSLFTITMVASAFVVSIRNLPMMAETGMQMIFFAIFAALFFFLPDALVSAELASGWPKEGGLYVWVKEAFGERWGFIAIWIQWNYMILSVIAMFYFVGGALAYVFAPHLANDRLFLILITLAVVWFFTYLCWHGQTVSSLISTIGFLGGVVLPGAVVIIFGLIYILQGDPIQLNWSLTAKNLLPDFRHLSTLVLLVGFMRAFTGIEAAANHVTEVKHPRRNFPIAVLLVVIIGITINVLGSMSIAIVIPKANISFVAGIMEAFEVFFTKFHLAWLVPVMALLVAGGAAGGASTWMMGPIKGVLAASKHGELPPKLQTVNQYGVPSYLLIIQAIVISVVSILLLMMPSINVAFWVSVALSMMIYVTMYSFMLLAGIRLRYKKPNQLRAYAIPGPHNMGMWITAGIGLLTSLFMFFIALIPPAGISTENNVAYIATLLIAILTMLALPCIIYALRDKTHQE